MLETTLFFMNHFQAAAQKNLINYIPINCHKILTFQLYAAYRNSNFLRSALFYSLNVFIYFLILQF